MTAGDALAAIDRVAAQLRAGGCDVQPNVRLDAFTTYRVGGPARWMVTLQHLDQLPMIGDAVRRAGAPLLVVGRGSNMLVADAGFSGIALSLAGCADFIEIDGATSRVVAGAMTFLPVLARRTVAAGLTGFEWAVGVPGSVGGAVRMNAGGHGADMTESLVRADLFQVSTGHRRWVELDHLGMRFRSSGLTDDDVVIQAELQLAPALTDAGEQTLAGIVKWRRENQPGGHNAGSVFVNPVPGEVTAGALIDGLGLRGARVGTASVSDKHANFIQSDEGGTAADVVALMQLVRQRVASDTGYMLRSEVRLVGFEDDPIGIDADAAGGVAATPRSTR
jgi:UDP-N-acetylmuramate dehydrogenase